ncbi:sigma 54-interacting transcriptional regulator [Clostridium colicanis]|uniref:HTH-type transcriptional regulatory protein TyrR n=1 Tax=Clostridium colicanis DSM 13634 TaxID=1121305 RepID=A0A151AMN1_9CLOT|nr:sigma 54-interacting transcriptional regulator [Clostridium colicanis]KYH28852.1 transcriptional regulatory protein ZraR [Clostridium colicanis DSM 13634]
MFANKVTINIEDGVHTRIAAMIVQKASQIKHKYNLELYIKKYENSEPLAISMLALLSLKIVKGETVEILCNDDSLNGKKAIIELCDFITKKLDTKNSSMTNLDAILEENTIATEQILQNLPVGVIVIDANSNITTINSYGLKLIDKDSKEVIGKNITDIIPNSDLPSILKNSRIRYGDIKYVNNHMVIVNASPIISNGKIIGAVKIFQDISELVGIKELNEKLKSILETSHELICFVDENRKISYINPAYEKYFNIDNEDIVGKDLIEVSPKGFRMKSFNSKKKIENVVHQKGDISLISTIQPIFIEDSFKGVISISKPANEIKDLVKKLDNFEEELNYYKQELQRHTKLNSSFKSIIGSSGTLRECLIIADKASKSSSTVLIRGESGTGKELIANAIHNSSDRKNKPFIRVNCAAIPENLLESELFGYEKGAFTGATKSKPGKFALAHEGSIFLDEIGDLSPSMQVKLLRVIQEKEFESIGGLKTQKVDVRIIAATNKNLEEMMKSGEFREDLYYRLNVISIHLPPLRERKEDINLLLEHFIEKISNKLNKKISGISPDVMPYLQNYDWPGNIRELENVVERAINMCDGDFITLKDFPFYIKSPANTKQNNALINISEGELKTMEEYEKEIISLAMKKYKSFNKAGKALGLTHRTVSLKCKKYGIEF